MSDEEHDKVENPQNQEDQELDEEQPQPEQFQQPDEAQNQQATEQSDLTHVTAEVVPYLVEHVYIARPCLGAGPRRAA